MIVHMGAIHDPFVQQGAILGSYVRVPFLNMLFYFAVEIFERAMGIIFFRDRLSLHMHKLHQTFIILAFSDWFIHTTIQATYEQTSWRAYFFDKMFTQLFLPKCIFRCNLSLRDSCESSVSCEGLEKKAAIEK